MTESPDDDFTYKSQDVDYLGFLEAQLRDLQDVTTMAYELIQNADDVGAEDGPAVSRLIFDVTDEALVVENDGRFRDVDFARLQSIASGAKREERGTTGAFGLGFIAVYQVTDAPEIFSSGRHWRIRPEAPPEQRIEERPATGEGTRFRLPYAFDEASAVRRALRLGAIRPQELDDLAAGLAGAIGPAALFLRRLRLLEVKRSGRLLRRIERRLDVAGRLTLTDEAGRADRWLLLSGDFDEAAAALRAHYPWQIEAARHSTVRLALPWPETTAREPELNGGRLYATLPTAFGLPLPLHIDADFYPTVDRKSIHFADGYQAEWNQAAINAAAQLLAAHMARLPALLGPVRLWWLIEQTAAAAQAAGQGELPPVFRAFWQELAPRLPHTAILFTADGRWQPPASVRLLPTGSEPAAALLLAELGLSVPHPSLAAFRQFLGRPEIGAAALGPADVSQTLVQAGLTGSIPLAQAPPFLRRLEDWQTLWRLLDTLLSRPQRPGEREEILAQLRPCALALSRDLTLERLDGLYRGPAETQALFPDVKWLNESLPAGQFPGRYVTEFGVRQAVEWLAEQPIESLEAAWRFGRLDIARLFRWFEARPIEIFADDPALQKEIRRLPLVPVDGQLRPLAGLYLPGGFADPLHLAGVIDPEPIGGRRQFLIDLGLTELSFESYVHGPMQQALAQHPDLPSDARHELARLLAERLGELRDDTELQEQLSGLPLVACLDGSFRPGREVYLTRDAVELLGGRAHIAEPAGSQALQSLYRWLGVREQPAAADLVEALLATAGSSEPDGEMLATARRCWRRLAELLAQNEIAAAALAPLQGQPAFPGRGDRLIRPEQLLVNDRPELAARFSQRATFEVYLLLADDPLAGAALAAGARPLSQAAQQQILVPDEAAALPAIQKRIASRRGLLARLLRGEGVARAEERLAFLDRLRVVAAGQVQVRYRLEIAGEVLVSEPEWVPAVLATDRAVLYVAYADEVVSWAAVARALAGAVRPLRPHGALAMGIKEVLAAESSADAAHTLDELGYP